MKEKEIRALIKINYNCNNKCLFCHRGGVRGKEIPYILEKKILEAQKLGVSTIELSGGEPTIQKNIINILSTINYHGMKSGIISNGRMFYYGAFLEKFINLNTNYFFISLHSHNHKKHDFLTGTKNSWKQTVGGIENIAKQKTKPQLIVNCVVVNQNIDDLEKIVLFLKTKNVKEIKFSFPFLLGEMKKNRGLMPLVDFAGERISEALSLCEKNNIKGLYGGLPFCVINKKHWAKIHSLERTGIYYVFEPTDTNFKSTSLTVNNKNITCLECSYSSLCVDFFLEDTPMDISPIYRKRPNKIIFFSSKKNKKNHPKSIFVHKEGFYEAKEDLFMIKEIKQVKESSNILYSKRNREYFLEKRDNIFLKTEKSFYGKIKKEIENIFAKLNGNVLFVGENKLYKNNALKDCLVLNYEKFKKKDFFQKKGFFDYIVLNESYNKIKYLKKELDLFKLLLNNNGKLVIFERKLFGVLENKEARQKKENYRNHCLDDCMYFLEESGFKIMKKNNYDNFWIIIASKV